MQVQRRARAMLAAASVLAVGIAGTAGAASARAATPAAVSGGPATVTVGSTGAFDLGADTPVNSFIDKDGTFYAETADGSYTNGDPRTWYFLTGDNLDDAALDTTLTNANGDTTERCDNSPTGLEATNAPAGSSYDQRNYCDLNGVWVDPDTGNWYGLVHNEFTPQPYGDNDHFDAIDYAESTDQGKTWTILGHAITSPYPTVRGDTAAFPQQTYDYGDGDPRLYVDTASGYFYVYYGSRIVDKNGNWQTFYEHVARAPIADKMATGSWRKWYDGKWAQPGVGGKESDMVPVTSANPKGYVSPADEYNPDTPGTAEQQVAAGEIPATSPMFVMDITYDAYLGLYIGEPQSVDQSGNAPQQFYATSNLATQQWHLIGDTGSYTDASWYRWFLDGANAASSTVVGKQFRSYCFVACNDPDDDGEYANVTISDGSPSAPVTSGGTYRIASGAGRQLAQDGRTSGTTSLAPDGSPLSDWTFTANGDGSYTITNAATRGVLGVSSSSAAGRAWGTRPAVTAAAAGGPTVGQQWWVLPDTSPVTGARTGSFHLVNRYSGLVLALSANPGRTAETTPTRSWTSPGRGGVGDGRTAAEQTLTLTPVRGGAGHQ